jgi:hypothetical protein
LHNLLVSADEKKGKNQFDEKKKKANQTAGSPVFTDFGRFTPV